MISQKKLAEKLRMPVSTVANILHGTPRYKTETKERVLKAAAEWGYRPNRACLSIRRGRSNLIGIVHFDSSYKTTRDAVASVQKEVVKLGYNYLVINVDWHNHNAQEVLDEILQLRAEGMILIGNSERTFDAESLEVLKKANIPVVSYRGDLDLNVPWIGDDAQASFFSLTQHLQKIGHRSILFPLYASLKSLSVLRRIAGFKAAIKPWGDYINLTESEFGQEWPKLLREHKNKNFGVVLGLGSEERFQKGHPIDIVEDYQAFGRKIFASGALPDAVMCSNDRGAIGMFNAACEMKIRIPEDMAVTGADNEDFGEYPMFRLTSIQSDIQRSAQAAAECLNRVMKKKSCEGQQTVFPTKLVLRQSCGRIASSGENPTVMVATVPPASKAPKRKMPTGQRQMPLV